MIRLRQKRLTRRRNAAPQTGTDQSIYRVLCIAMISDEDPENGKIPLYTAAAVTRFGFDPAELKDLYIHHGDALYNWARGKEIHLHSDHRDGRGNRKHPHKWTRINWQDRVADMLWNQAADILEKACNMHQKDGQAGDSYWYSEVRGLYRVSSENYQTNLAEVRELQAIMKAAKMRGEDFNERLAIEESARKKSSLKGAGKKKNSSIWVPGKLLPVAICLLIAVNPFWHKNRQECRKVENLSPLARIAEDHFHMHSMARESRLPIRKMAFPIEKTAKPQLILRIWIQIQIQFP